MRKARVPSILCTSLALCAAQPAAADLPPPGCYARDYPAEHLSRHPDQGVAALRLWFFHEDDAGEHPAVLVEAEMAAQGQGARDGAQGATLTQYALCDRDGACYVECDGGLFTSELLEGGDLRIATSFFALGNSESCGGTSDLAEGPDETTAYRLAPQPPEACRSLWQPHPLPGPGCYGVDYSDMGHGQGLLAMRLFLHPADEGFAFPQAQGSLRVTLPDGGRARQAGLGGARIAVPVWCSTRDGACRSAADEGALAITPLGDGLALSTSRFLVFGAEAAHLDIALPGHNATRHQLRPLPAAECRGME